MPSIGPLEILVVAVVALIVFGPERLPEIAKTIGRTASNLRRMAGEVREEFELGLDDDEVFPEPPGPRRARPRTTGRDDRSEGAEEAPATDEAGASGEAAPGTETG
jgi:Tat protein translocase TatB subunit